MTSGLWLMMDVNTKVLTVEQIRKADIDNMVTPPYLFVETNIKYKRKIADWYPWMTVIGWIRGWERTPFTKTNYNVEWRCWNLKPSEEQKRSIPWKPLT